MRGCLRYERLGDMKEGEGSDAGNRGREKYFIKNECREDRKGGRGTDQSSRRVYIVTWMHSEVRGMTRPRRFQIWG
jgi:hypothetical protein